MPAPPSMVEVSIRSGDARLNGLFYLAAGRQPHPLVVFLHGYPGYEKNLDLAQAVRRAGYHVLYADYRGAWGSGGVFSFKNSLEDTKAILRFVREPATATKYGIDTRRMALVGHSLGGWVALMSAGDEPPTVCVAALAAWNVGGAALRFPDHADEMAAELTEFRESTDPAGGPVRAHAEDLLAEMLANASRWDYLQRAAALGNRALLLVAASHDSVVEDIAMHEELANVARSAGNHHVSLVTYNDDHQFSAHRLALAHLLTGWLRDECAATQKGAQ
jgi:pimeloyl-ACP methyl ester carboxylesterase